MNREMKNLFKDCKTVSDCEEKLNKLIDVSPTVYGYGITPMASSLWNMNGPEKEQGPHTHQAKLMFIEPIKQPCKHEPRSINISAHALKDAFAKAEDLTNSTKCKHCGVELKATWSEK